jgi:hypothetical protein
MSLGVGENGSRKVGSLDMMKKLGRNQDQNQILALKSPASFSLMAYSLSDERL